MLALLLYGVVLADPLPVEGWDGQVAWEELPQPVVGGTQVAAGDWDDAAAIVFYGSWVGCTGTLIAPDVVLTAGHCVGGISHVILGSKDWDSNEGEVIAVDRTYEYPDSWWTYDAAVLKLAEPSSYPPRAIGMDCITDHWLEDGAEVVVVGYGMTDAAGTHGTTELREGVTVVQDADCGADYIDGWWSGCNESARPGGELGAGGNGVDACFGDSGGPLYLPTDWGSYVVGVTSRAYGGVPWDLPCKYGGVYTRPDAIVDWIEEKVGPVTKPVCNRPPEPEVPNLRVDPNGTATARIEVNDPDDATGATFAVVVPAAYGSASVDGSGQVTYHAADRVGSDLFVVEVTDGGVDRYPRTGKPVSTQLTVFVEVSGPSESAGMRFAGGCGCHHPGPTRAQWLVLPLLLALRRRA